MSEEITGRHLERPARPPKKPPAATVDVFEQSVEPRYVIVVRSAIIAVALASTEADARKTAEPFQHLPGVEVSIKRTPLNASDLADVSDLLDTITKTIIEVKVTSVLKLGGSPFSLDP